MNPVFIDTSYFLALEIANDQNHQLAKDHWQRVIEVLPPLVTTTYIFDKAVTYLNSRGFHAKATQLGDNLLQSPSVEITHVDEALFFTGWHFFRQHRDKKYSLTDPISFTVMERRGISSALRVWNKSCEDIL